MNASDLPNSNSDAIILQPRPSNDPEDPLNWKNWRKQLAIWQVNLYVFAIGIATAVQYSVLTQIADDTGITVGQLNTGTGLMFLFLGWGCLIWQPIAMTYGRRGAYIISCILSIIPMVWAPYSRGSAQWYAHRSLLGLFAAPVESLPEVSVPDLFFAHQRGTYMAIYAFILFGSNFLAPFFAGFINDGAGWHAVMYFGAAILALCAVINFFFLEETMYFRSTAEGDDDIIEVQPVIQEEPKTVGNTAGDDKNGSADEEVTGTNTTMPGEVSSPTTYVSKLKLFVVLPGRPTPSQMTLQSWRALTNLIYFPSIVWAGLLYGTNLAWYNVLNATTSSILGSEPYNFKPTMVGVSYLSPFFAASIACVWSGQFADWLMLRLARRNNGTREPEQRLWALLLSAILSSGGLILWGVGASRDVHYMGPIFGLGFVTFGVVCGGSISLSYAVDCFKDIAGESMITVIIIRNTLGFAFSYAITPWIDASGLQNTFVAVSMVSLACTLSFLAMIVFGKRLRKWSAKRYWSYVDEKTTMGGH
jgi:MFS family permease